jgi:hypothetical protein
MQAEAVFLGVDADRAKAQLGGRAKDANSDLATIGGEKFLNRFVILHSEAIKVERRETRYCFTTARWRSSSLFDSPEKPNSSNR